VSVEEGGVLTEVWPTLHVGVLVTKDEGMLTLQNMRAGVRLALEFVGEAVKGEQWVGFPGPVPPFPPPSYPAEFQGEDTFTQGA
jgi:hypothetical protein